MCMKSPKFWGFLLFAFFEIDFEPSVKFIRMAIKRLFERKEVIK